MAGSPRSHFDRRHKRSRRYLRFTAGQSQYPVDGSSPFRIFIRSENVARPQTVYTETVRPESRRNGIIRFALHTEILRKILRGERPTTSANRRHHGFEPPLGRFILLRVPFLNSLPSRYEPDKTECARTGTCYRTGIFKAFLSLPQ